MLKMFRKRFLPLPFQYYLGMVGDKKAPQALGIEEQFGKDELLVIFDEEGSIWVDDEEFGKIIQLSSSLITENFINDVIMRYENVVLILSKVCQEAAKVSNETNLVECLELFLKWFNAVINYGPFLMITKFLPDSTLNLFKSKETGFIEEHPEIWRSIVSPLKSKSVEFTKSILNFYIFCLEQNIDFETTNLTIPVLEVIENFKKTWRGFGPREWELPGYESTSYLLSELRKYFLGLSLHEARKKLGVIEDMEIQNNIMFSSSLNKLKSLSKNYPETQVILSFLWYLQEILEAENQIYRGSFYFGVLPLLRAIGNFLCKDNNISHKEDILFLFPPEILAYSQYDLDKLAEKRKEIYWRVVTEEEKGILPSRLEVIMDGDYKR
jgi:hypothetical protein